jgi:hypothetical protein
MNEGHRKLQIYQETHRRAIEVHTMTLRLSSVGRFENEFVHFLFRAHGSCEKTGEHLTLFYDSKSLTDKQLSNQQHDASDIRCGKILRYIQSSDQTFEAPHCIKEPDIPSIVNEPTTGNTRTIVTCNQKPITSNNKFQNTRKKKLSL